MRRLVAASLIALALAATACGKGGSNQGLARLDQTGFISQAAARSVEQRTARIEITQYLSAPISAGGESISLTANGEIDMVKKVMDLNMYVPAEMGFRGVLQMVLAGNTVYTRVPEPLRKTAGLSKPWLGMKIGKLASSPLNGGNLTDPSSILAALSEVASNVTKTGDAMVRGVHTTKYEVTLDIKKLASSAPAFERDAISQLKFDHMNVYVGDDNLVRREEFTVTVGGGSDNTLIDIFDYGAPVRVTVPPRSQVEFKSAQDLMSGK